MQVISQFQDQLEFDLCQALMRGFSREIKARKETRTKSQMEQENEEKIRKSKQGKRKEKRSNDFSEQGVNLGKER